MIEHFQLHTAHLFEGDIIAATYRARYELFVKHAGWELDTFPTPQGLIEYDEFDTPAAHHFVYRDEEGQVLGMLRNLVCDRPYMMHKVFRNLVPEGNFPDRSDWCESTRSGILPSVTGSQKSRILAELNIAGTEWALASGIQHFLLCSTPEVIESIYRPANCNLEVYGPPITYPDGFAYQAVHIEVTEAIVDFWRDISGISGPVLKSPELEQQGKTRKVA